MGAEYLYCHPCFEEWKWAYRFSYELHREFRGRGLQLYRFDYVGTGEDHGEFADVTVKTMIRDIHQQVKLLDPTPTLIGLRLGATLAACYAASLPNTIKQLVLVEPVVNGADYVRHMQLQQQITDTITQSVHPLPDNNFVNLHGYKTSQVFIQELKALDLNEILPRVSATCRTNYVSVTSTGHRICKAQRWLGERWERSGVVERFITIHCPQPWQSVRVSDYLELVDLVASLSQGKQ